MPVPRPVPSEFKISKPLIVLGVIFFLLISVLIFAGLRASSLFRQNYEQSQSEQLNPPLTPVKRDIKRVLLKQTLEDGSIQFIEILPNGLVNIYDENMSLIKSDLSSYYKVRRLYQKINQNLDSLTSDSSGNLIFTIDTNQGRFTIIFDQTIKDLIHDIINDILDDIEDIVDEAFAPTPTLAPTATLAPNAPTPTPITFPTTPPFGPSPTPDPSATPTPLPDYMTAPPFSCDDYRYLNRPINISNIICGVD